MENETPEGITYNLPKHCLWITTLIKYNILRETAGGITFKYSMINLIKHLDAPTATAPRDMIYGNAEIAKY